ncbi:MAG: flagellar biosynthetic protein FliR [Burkholderiales bacterium]
MLSISSVELDAWLAAFLFPFFRFAALLQTAPVTSHVSVPRRVRLGLALLLTIVVAPTLPPVAAGSPFTATGLLLIVEQLAIGFAIGFTMQLAFAAVTLAGDLIGLQMGLSFASLMDPAHNDQVPLVGAFLSLVLTLAFLAMNGHLLLVTALVHTFEAFPISADALARLDWRHLAQGATVIFAAGFAIALPAVAALLVASLALGVLTRTAPQLNLFAVGFPLTLGIGILMLFLAMPFTLPAMEGVVNAMFAFLPR